MGRAKLARVEGAKPCLQPTKAKEANPTVAVRPQGDPKTRPGPAGQYGAEVDAVRSVIGSIVSDLTDVDVDFSDGV